MRRKLWWRAFAVLSLATLALAAGVAAGLVPQPFDLPRGMATVHDFLGPDPAPAPEPEEGALRVKTVHPRRDPALAVTVEQLAVVEPYYQVELRARVAGVVGSVRKDIGDRVARGELLVEIDVPELHQEVAQKESVVGQRRQEVRLAVAQVANAEALLEVARAEVVRRQAEVGQAQAEHDHRLKRLHRFRELARRGAYNAELVEEHERDYRSAEAALEGARGAVQKARADVKEKQTGLETARVEVDLKKALVDVAGKDLERARVLAGFARITAPFDGTVVRRGVDPGDFVQNASTGRTDPLLTVARTDLVTVVARVPDNAAPYVRPDTEAVIQLAELPGVAIRGAVSRFSPSVDSSDRTMRVEIDLHNEAGAARGDGADAPLRPTGLGRDGPRLLPGMTGLVRLRLRTFADAYLLPSSAVFSRGGKSYVLEVRDGVAHLLPVRVQVNDGTLAKVAVVSRGPGGQARELTGSEQIVASRQAEIEDGQPVRPVPGDMIEGLAHR